MPAVPLHRAIATKSSIGALFAMAEAEGFVEIWLNSEHQCKLIRNKCYAWRSRIRKQGMALTSVETSPYDGYTFTWAFEDTTARWRFRIDSDEQIEFEIIINANAEHPPVIPPGFDWVTDSDLPQLTLDQAEGMFHAAANEFSDEIPL